MDPLLIQKILTNKYRGDDVKIARTAHFMGLIKSGIDGMASLGVVLDVQAQGVEGQDPTSIPPTPNVLESLESAIAHMQRVSSHATHEEGD